MFTDLRQKFAGFISPERERFLNVRMAAQEERERNTTAMINQRVAEIVSKMDPLEPMLKRYNIIFSKEYTHPEEPLDGPSQFRLFMWAYGMKEDPSFKYITDWVRNTQGNATVRKAVGEEQWFFGRAMIASIGLIIDEVSRLASRYEDIVAKRDRSFDAYLPVE